jgi:hypothetical protein
MLALAAYSAYETNLKLILPCLCAQSGAHA